MPEFVDGAVRDIDERLRALRDEVSRLEAARSALAGPGRRRGRSRGATTRSSRTRAARRSTGPRRTRSPRRGGNTRAVETLELVRKKPGMTIPELAKAMNIQPNYLYRVLPKLEAEGQVKRDGQGWHPAG